MHEISQNVKKKKKEDIKYFKKSIKAEKYGK